MLWLVIVVILVLLVLEVGLFWAAVSLADGPEIGAGKTIGGALGVGVLSGGVSLAIFWVLGLNQLQSSEPTLMRLLLGAGLAAVVFLVVPTVLCMPLLPVSPRKGLLISVLQLFLRALLYALVGGLIMVVLAVLQLSRRTSLDIERGAWCVVRTDPSSHPTPHAQRPTNRGMA
jgi:hypothetical protein